MAVLSLALAARSWALEPLPNLLKDWQGWVLEEADEAFVLHSWTQSVRSASGRGIDPGSYR